MEKQIVATVSRQLQEEYGKQIVSQVATQLQEEYGKKGFEPRSIWRMMQFAQYFPDSKIVSAVSTQLQEEYDIKGFDEKNVRRMMQFAKEFPDFQIVSPLVSKLSWTHFRKSGTVPCHKFKHSAKQKASASASNFSRVSVPLSPYSALSNSSKLVHPMIVSFFFASIILSRTTLV